MMADLFTDSSRRLTGVERLAPGAVVLRGFAAGLEPALIEAVNQVTQAAPFRHMVTPGGFRMSTAMSNCGALGWVSSRKGYRYVAADPLTGMPWAAMPDLFRRLAAAAARIPGFQAFVPDACLLSRYEPGARISLHQDRDESDLTAPIVSVSLGVPAVFLFGGLRRTDRPVRVPLYHGDVVVWGGCDRLRYHGILPLAEDRCVLLGRRRINLSFRKARRN